MPTLASLAKAEPVPWILTTSTQWQRITPLSSEPSWHSDALQDIARLGRLQNNWDGYGSPPMEQAALRQAIVLLDAIRDYCLPAPEICPVSGGGIGIAWQLYKRELEIEILPDGSAEFLMVEDEERERKTTEGRLPPNPTATMQRLANWIING